MCNKFFLALYSAISIVSYVKANPNWTVNESSFAYSMTITGVVNVNNQEYKSNNYIIAAFVGTECRGVSELIPSIELNRSYAYLTVYSNTSSDSISFKLYNTTTEQILSVYNNYLFTSDASIGTHTNPFVFSNLNLSTPSLESFIVNEENVTFVQNDEGKIISVIFPMLTNSAEIHVSILSSIGSTVYLNDELFDESTPIDFEQNNQIRIVSQYGKEEIWTLLKIIDTKVLNYEQENSNIYIKNNLLYIQNTPLQATITIVDVMGKTLYTCINDSNEKILPVHEKIVFISIHSQNKSITRKVIRN